MQDGTRWFRGMFCALQPKGCGFESTSSHCVVTLEKMLTHKGPSIYDVHMEGGGSQAQVDACGRGRGGQAPCGRPHRKLKLKSTDVILSSSHAKKVAYFFYQNFVLGRNKSGHFSAI